MGRPLFFRYLRRAAAAAACLPLVLIACSQGARCAWVYPERPGAEAGFTAALEQGMLFERELGEAAFAGLLPFAAGDPVPGDLRLSGKTAYKLRSLGRTMIKGAYRFSGGIGVYARAGLAGEGGRLLASSGGTWAKAGGLPVPENFGSYSSVSAYSAEDAFAGGLGIDLRRRLTGGVEIGLDAQYLLHSNRAAMKTTRRLAGHSGATLAPYDLETAPAARNISFSEWQLAPFAAREAGRIFYYAGLKYSYSRVEVRGEGSLPAPPGDWGAFAGLSLGLSPGLRLCLEGSFLDETAVGLSVSFPWRNFPLRRGKARQAGAHKAPPAAPALPAEPGPEGLNALSAPGVAAAAGGTRQNSAPVTPAAGTAADTGVKPDRGLAAPARRKRTAKDRAYEAALRKIYKSRVQVPAGKFMMGSPEGQGSPDERPRHGVSLGAYGLDAHEVTAGQYREFSLKAGIEMAAQPAWSTDRHPVVMVDFRDASKYCEWAGGRLPTEAEWEKAARAGTDTLFSFGDDAAELGVYAWHSANSGGGARPVASRKPNAYGVYDMHGNVWEWVRDRYDQDYYSAAPEKDPKGPDEGSFRVIRGGSWNYYPKLLRPAVRAKAAPQAREVYLGFRCAYP